MPCTLVGCGRPAPDSWADAILSLYQECKDRGALPKPGGVMDQPADMMGWFTTIDRVVHEHRERQRELMERERLHG